MIVGIAVWVAYQWWPPRQRVAALSVGLVGLLVLIWLLGWPTSTVAQRRVSTLEYASPQEQVRFPCGSWVLQPLGRTREPAARSDRGHQRVQLQDHHHVSGLPPAGQPVICRLRSPRSAPGRRRVLEISGRFVAAQYGDVIVIAGSNRLSSEADQLFGLGATDGTQRWHFQCGSPRPRTLTVRFARVPAGDDPARGHVTLGETRPQVIVTCEGRTLGIDPVTGAQR